MKKNYLLVLIISLFLPTTLSVNATNDVLPHILVNDDFGYEYSEYIDEDNRIIRTYTKEEQSRTYNNIARNSINDGSMDQEKTKSLLKDLGMNDSFFPTDLKYEP